MNLKNFRLINSILLVFTFATFFSCSKNEEGGKDNNIKGIEVSAGNPVKRKMIEYLQLNGNTIYLKQEIVRAAFQGYIEKSFKNIGDNIKAGDILFQIRTKESDAAADSKSVPGIEQYGGVVKIYARTDGILSELTHQSGDFVTDADQLAVLVDPASLKIVLEAPYRFNSSIRTGDSFFVTLPDDKELTARVEKKIPTINNDNQTLRFILVPNQKIELPANLNVSIKFPLKSYGDAVALPKSAVMANEMQTEFWIMKLLNDTTAVKVPVIKGLEADSFIQISSPILNLNDRFITVGAYGLPDTAHVSISSNRKEEE